MSNAAFAQPSIRIPSLFLSVITLCLFLGATGHRAFALSCGDNVTTDTTLTADLGPCPGNGLGVDGITAHVTIKLNGHRIIGSGTGDGVVLGTTSPGVTIKGPGQILNFQTGIAMGGAAANVLVDQLSISGSQTGIGINGSPGPIEIKKNFILGESQGQTGLSYGDAGGIYIHDNTIANFSSAGVLIQGESSSRVENNIVTLNQVGIYSSEPDLSGCNEIRKNFIQQNSGNGIQFGTTSPVTPNVLAPPAPKCEISKNDIAWNGGSGISITGGSFSLQVHENIVFFNAVDGIAIFGTNDGPLTVTGNQAFANRTDDLFWNGAGTSACWSHNFFFSSNPATLPACP
jgi:Right handed beta helix region